MNSNALILVQKFDIVNWEEEDAHSVINFPLQADKMLGYGSRVVGLPMKKSQ